MSDSIDSLFSYDPEIGEIRWAVPRRGIRRGSVAGFIDKARGYRHVMVDGRSYLAARLAWRLYYGKWPEGEIDHIDHNKSNDRIANLRDVDHVSNSRNRPLMKTNTSGVTGVHFDISYGKWKATIRLDGDKKKTLGQFEDFEEAVRARQEALKEHHYHENHGK